MAYSPADTYGRRPDPVALANPFKDLSQVYGGLEGTNSALSSEIMRMITGSDPNLPALAQNSGAVGAARAGLSGSGFGDRMADLSLYDRRAQQRQQGIQNYNQTIPTISATQTNSPALQQANQSQNNVWASAPDPAAATQNALQLYQSQLGALSGGFSTPQIQRPSYGGGGGGIGTPAPAQQFSPVTSYAGTRVDDAPIASAGSQIDPFAQWQQQYAGNTAIQQPQVDPYEQAWWDIYNEDQDYDMSDFYE